MHRFARHNQRAPDSLPHPQHSNPMRLCRRNAQVALAEKCCWITCLPRAAIGMNTSNAHRASLLGTGEHLGYGPKHQSRRPSYVQAACKPCTNGDGTTVDVSCLKCDGKGTLPSEPLPIVLGEVVDMACGANHTSQSRRSWIVKGRPPSSHMCRRFKIQYAGIEWTLMKGKPACNKRKGSNEPVLISMSLHCSVK